MTRPRDGQVLVYLAEWVDVGLREAGLPSSVGVSVEVVGAEEHLVSLLRSDVLDPCLRAVYKAGARSDLAAARPHLAPLASEVAES